MSDPTHHSHAHRPDDPEPSTDHELMGIALRDLLIEKGIFTADEERAMIEKMEAADPSIGARVVARAWTDDSFKEALLADGNRAVAQLGHETGYAQLVVPESTSSVHNIVVCTLCSCYPRTLLGPQPAWYKSLAYRSRVVREPRKVLAEFGTTIADDVEVRVHDSTAEMRYLVLPVRPKGTDGWSEEELAKLVTRDCMIGVAVPKVGE